MDRIGKGRQQPSEHCWCDVHTTIVQPINLTTLHMYTSEKK